MFGRCKAAPGYHLRCRRNLSKMGGRLMAYAVIWGTVVSLIIEAVLIAGIELCGHYVIYCPLFLMDSFSLPHNRIHPVSKLFLSKITSYEWFVTVIQGLDAVIVPSTTAIILYYLACLLE